MVITGVRSGFGRATTLRLAREEAWLSHVNVSESGLGETRQEITCLVARLVVLLTVADVSVEVDVAR